MGHGHTHGHSHGASGHGGHASSRAGARFQKRLAISFALIATFFVVEAVAGVITNSLALLSDAGHMLTDVIGIGMALAAIQLANRHEARRAARAADVAGGRVVDRNTFGLYRLEILAAFVNAILLIGVAVYVVVEAVRRIGDEPEILSSQMLIVAVLGLAVNLIAFVLLKPGAEESVNVEGAYLEVLADTVGSVGVIVAALLMRWFDWAWVDPLVGAAIGVWILPRTIRLGGQAVRILLQAAPPDIDVDALAGDLAAIPDVLDVHDLHLWTLTSDMENVSVHLVVPAGSDSHGVLDAARALLQDRYGIAHATLQVEPDDHQGCDELAW